MSNYPDLDRFFWGDYVSFGSQARLAAAQVMYDKYQRAADDRARKYYGLQVFAEFMLGAEDLFLVCAAFRDRTAQRTALQGLMETSITKESEKQIFKQLAQSVTDSQIRRRLRLPEPDDVSAIAARYPNRDSAEIAKQLRDIAAALHNARYNRHYHRRLGPRILAKLKHGFVAVTADDPAYKPGDELMAHVLVDDRKSGSVFPYGVPVGPASVNSYINTLDWYTRTVRDLITLCHGH